MKLTDKAVKNQKQPGRYGDGGGLWLQVRAPDADKVRDTTSLTKSWLFRYTFAKKQRQMGLGPYPDIGLAEARDMSLAARKVLRQGSDPLTEKRTKAAEAKAVQAAMTFRAVAALHIQAHQKTWKNEKHRQQWANTLNTYVFPIFGDHAVEAIATGDVMRVLEPIWQEKPETASRVRSRIETVLDYATARGWRTGENPARWRGHVENLLPKRSKVAKVEHHAAMAWTAIGAFMAKLEKQSGMGALALRFTILTAARTGEVIDAQWAEIDMKAATWTVPAERMKAGKEHRVPLSEAAMNVLRQMLPGCPTAGDGHVFLGAKANTGLSNMSLAAVLKRMNLAHLTVHGFRSTFRQWVGDRTNVAREVAEAALAHSLKDKTEAAYARNDLFDRRRKLMESWADFCGTIERDAGEVVSIRRAS